MGFPFLLINAIVGLDDGLYAVLRDLEARLKVGEELLEDWTDLFKAVKPTFEGRPLRQSADLPDRSACEQSEQMLILVF